MNDWEIIVWDAKNYESQDFCYLSGEKSQGGHPSWNCPGKLGSFKFLFVLQFLELF